jgi:hypothetical protein
MRYCHTGLFCKILEGLDDVRRCLDQLDQHAVAGNWCSSIPFGMDERNVVPSRSWTNPPWCESNTFLLHPFDRRFKIINPQTDMIEWRDVDLQYAKQEPDR